MAMMRRLFLSFLWKSLKSGLGASSVCCIHAVSIICLSKTVPVLSISHTSFFSENEFREKKKKNIANSFFNGIKIRKGIVVKQAPFNKD